MKAPRGAKLLHMKTHQLILKRSKGMDNPTLKHIGE